MSTCRIRLRPYAVFILQSCANGRSARNGAAKSLRAKQKIAGTLVGLEFGFICVYRAGWKLSVGNLTASITLACVLLLVGRMLYRETITLRQLAGMALCALGMVMMAK